LQHTSSSPEHSYLKLATSEMGKAMFELGIELEEGAGVVLDKAVVADAGVGSTACSPPSPTPSPADVGDSAQHHRRAGPRLTARLRSPAMTRRVAIAGAALSDCGRVDVKSNFELHYQGTARAVADAGLTKDDVQGFMSTGLGNLPPVEVAEYLGLQPTWVDSTQVAGGAGGDGRACLRRHCYGSRRRRCHGLRVDDACGSQAQGAQAISRRLAWPDAVRRAFGHALIAKYAMSTRRHMHEFGTTIEQLAEIAVSARHNAGLNPTRITGPHHD